MSMIKAHTEAMKQIADVGWDLEILANAFEATGNGKVAYDLRGLARVLAVAKHNASEALGAELNRSFKYAQDGTANMLAVALALSR